MIRKLNYGNTNTFFIRGTGGGLLIDTDLAGTLPAFYRAIKEHNIKTRDISYVLATHYHPDHMGLISELMGQGIKLLLMDTQKAHVHFADEIFRRDKRLQYEPIHIGNSVSINRNNNREFLENIGIAGEIVSTPSHSADSISLILDNGTCFVGDLEPIEYLDAYDGNEKLESDWKCIMSYHPKIIYYAHANEKVL